ncbi:MAG TPA: 4Fe-4S binding protein [Dehalococcoidia bacterium]|nr:4Fe-4S binding protein [Dehalococcoidia bacterium]
MAYGVGVIKGLMVVLRHLGRKPFTVEFPEEVRPIPHRARTSLLWFDERCTGCSTCAQACPDGCILVETRPNPDGTLTKVRYEIDFRICMYCGLCTEACPYLAIQPGGPFRDAAYNFDDMHHDKYKLTRTAHEYLRTHDYRYPHGQRAPQQVIEFIEAEARGEFAPPPPGTHAQIPAQVPGFSPEAEGRVAETEAA